MTEIPAFHNASPKFAKALKVKFQDLEFALDVETEAGVADSGDLDNDLTELLATVGAAAAERATAVVMFVDELQYVPEAQLASLIMALHSASQTRLPITMIGGGITADCRPDGPGQVLRRTAL